MDIEDFLPKRKNGNGNGKKKNGGKLTNDFGGIPQDSFVDLGAGFNGRFKNIGGGFLESVDIGRQPSINFAEGGRSSSAISPLFSDFEGKDVKGFGFKRGRLEKIADRELKETKKSKKKKEKEEKKGKRLGEVIAEKISEKRKQSQFSKEQIKREKEADRKTERRLKELIEEEKERKARQREGRIGGPGQLGSRFRGV